MQPSKFYFGGGAGDTIMHPLVALVMVVSIILTLVLPRKRIIVPFLICAFLIPVGQMLVVGGVHLFALRIVILFAGARMIFTKLTTKKSILGGRFDSVDVVFIVWATYRALAFLVLFSFQSAALVNQVAFLLDVFGGYFLVRFMIHDVDDIRLAVKTLAVIAFIVGLCMVNEKLRNQNIFGYLGGQSVVPQVRDGAIRAQGTFEHPILAGSFGATVLPLFFWLWHGCKEKRFAVIGAIGSTCMVLSAASSTPLLAYVAGIVGVCFWPMRNYMRVFRWGLVIVLLGLNVVMKASVWFLIARVDLTGASSGYHRAMLVDTFVRHFREWWLFGTTNNANWGFDMWDLSNQFVAEGVSGGLVTFGCFIALISMSFGKLGKARKAARGDRNQEWLFWFLGSALLSHVVAYFGISYFDHTQISWFALLAMISAATALQVKQKVKQPQIVFEGPALPLPTAVAQKAVRRDKTSPFSMR